MSLTSRKIVTGSVTADGSGGGTDVDATVIAAQGAGKIIRLMRGCIDVVTAATGGGGFASLEDGAGGTKFLSVPASAVGHFPFDFGDDGYPITANTLLNLTVDGATTNEAKAICTVTAWVAQ